MCARAAMLALGASALLFAPAARAATDTWLGVTSANFSTGFNAVPPQNGDTLAFGPAGAAGTTLTNDITGLSVGGAGTDGIDFLLTASPFTITGNAITLASSGAGIGIDDLALMAETISAPLTLASAQTINVGATDGALTLSGAVSGAFVLSKTGAGLLGLSAANSFSGMTITGGTVAIGTDGSLGSTTGTVTLDGGTLRTAFNGATVATLSAGRSFLLGDTGAGTGGSIDTGATNTTYAGVLANNGGTNSFTKTGANILTLGGINTYTGATIINAGSLVLNSTGSINSASTLVMGGSSTVLGVVADGNMSTFELQGISGTARTQTFAGLTLKAGISQILSEAVSTSATTIALGAIDHTTNPGGILAFSQLGYGGANTGLITTTTGNDATGILGGWAVINNTNPNASTAQVPTDYAANDGTGSIVAYTGYTAQAAGAIASSTTSNARVTAAGGVTLSVGAGTTDLNTLSNAGTATGTTTVTIATGGVLRLGASGGLLTASGAGGLNITGGGTLTAGGSAVANNPGTIYLIGGSGGFTLGTTIADNGTGAVTVVGSQYNNSNFTITGNNTYSGGTFLDLGRWLVDTNTGFGTGAVNVSNDAQAYLNFGGTMTNNFNIIGSSAGNNDTNSAIRFQGGQTLSGTITLLGDSQLQASSGTNTISGQITGGYNLTLTENGGATWVLSNPNNNWGGNLTINGTKVSLGASNVLPDGAAAGNVILTNNGNSILELNGYSDTINGLVSSGAVGVGTVQSTAAGASVLTVGGNNQSMAFNGLVSDGGAGKTLGITKIGTGTLVFGDSANAYLGGTTINGGTVRLSAISGATNSSIGAITGPLTVNTGGTLDLNSFSQTVGSLAGTGGVITSNVTGTPTLTVGTAGGTASTVFAGSIENGAATSIGLTVQGSTLDLTGANTYTGATNVTGGTLQLGTGGSIAGTSGIALSGTGSLMLGDAGGPVSATLANLTTTASNTVAGGATANSTLTLNDAGSATFANAFGGALTNQNNLNLVIAGTGTTPTTILSGNSSYTGTTTVNSGSTLNISGSLGNTAVTVNSGATVTGANINLQVIGGNLTVAGGATLTLSNPASFFSVGGNVTLGGTGAYAANHSTVNFTLGGNSTAEAFNVNGNLSLGTGGVYVDIINPTQTGTYNLANYSGSPTGFSLSSTAANITTQSVGRDNESLSSGGGSLTLTITGAATPATAYFNGYVSSVWNDLSNATRVNFSSNLAGTTDAGNVPGATSDVILNSTNAPTNRGTSTLTETLGANTIINSLSVNNVGTTTLAADGNSLTLEAAGGSVNAEGIGIVIAAGANPFTINPPLILGADQSWTNNSANLFTVGGTVTGVSSLANTLTLANTGAGGTTINGVIADGAGGTLALVVANTGAGVTTLTGANTYSGGTTLTSGTLTATGTGGLGVGFVSVDPTQNTAPTGTAADNAILNSTGSIASTAAVTVNSSTSDGGFGVGTLNLNGTTSSIGSLAGTGNGQVVLNNAAGTTLTVGNNNTSTTFAGVISNGAGTGSLVKVGTGTLDLTGANTYTGTTAVQNGTLQIGGGGSLVATSAVTLGNGTASGLLALGDGSGAVNQTLASLATSGTGTANAVVGGASAVSTLTFNNAAPITLGGTFGGTGTNQNNLALQFSGAGAVTLPTDNTYTGGTTVAAGSAVMTSTNAGLGANTAASTVTVNSGGTVDLNITTSLTYNYTFAGSGKVVFNFPGGGGDTEFASTAFNGFTGTIEVANPGASGNKFVINGSGLTGVSGASVQIDNGAQVFIGGGTANFANITVVGTGNSENRGAIRLNAGTIGGNISLLGNATIGNEGGTLTGNISTGVAGTSTLTMGTGNSQGSATLTGVLSDGTGQLALTQAFGTTTLSAASTYTGATTVTNGILSLTTGSINSSNSVSIASTGTLTLANSAALSDSAILTMVAGATLNLNGPSGTSELIASLVLDGTTEPAGIYTAAELEGFDSMINFGSSNGETLTIAAVPEPSSFWVALTGLGLFGYLLRCRISGRVGA